jgi:5-(carboxyamino)imidazole ribonucleotide synthase
VTIGILGGGQLGYMLALAGYPLGLRFRFLDPSPEAPVGRIAQRVTADFDDEAALEKFASGLELITYEFENVPVAATRFLSERVPVFPPPAALEVAQDRLKEKALFRKLGIATTEFAPIHNLKSLGVAVTAIGLPAVLKTTRFGYDGKGQWTLHTATDVDKLKSEIADAFVKSPRMNGAQASHDSAPFILERFISFTRELSLLGVRARNGDIVFYPLVQNRHHGGILRLSVAPAPSLAPGLQREAEDIARRILIEFDYAGVLAIEFFEYQGRLVANEMAPRVHNSGHWTIEGAITSQFENHLRAVLDLPLGSTKVYGSAAMLNLIGETPSSADVLAIPGAHLHLYGKSPRPGRKLGHITLWTSSFEQLAESLRALPPFFHQSSFCLDEPFARTSQHEESRSA